VVINQGQYQIAALANVLAATDSAALNAALAATNTPVQGTVTAREMIIEGQVKGSLDCSERIDVRASGRVTGNIRCNTLAVAEGGFFHGEIKMPAEEGQPLIPVETRESPQDEGEPETGDGIRVS